MMLPKIIDYVANDVDFKKRTFHNKIAKINNFPNQPVIRIEYFNMWARADVLVQLLEHKGIPYTKEEIS